VQEIAAHKTGETEKVQKMMLWAYERG